MTILRLWRGWTTPEHTDAYRALLRDVVAPGIVARELPGLHDFAVLHRSPRELDPASGGETLTAMWFDDPAAVAAFTGGDPSASVVPPAARALLTRFDRRSQHYVLADRPLRR